MGGATSLEFFVARWACFKINTFRKTVNKF